jgi:hypothetical protein
VTISSGMTATKAIGSPFLSTMIPFKYDCENVLKKIKNKQKRVEKKRSLENIQVLF